MSYVACRTEQYIVGLLTSLILYSITCSVIAQDRSKDIDLSTYKVKLSLSQLPKDTGPSNPFNTLQFNNNSIKASLKISPNKNQNLLLSYLSGDKKILSSNKSLVPASINTVDSDSFAYMPTSISGIPSLDKKAWESQIRAKYKNGLIKTVAPGVKHIQLRRATKAGSVLINVVEVNPAVNPDLRIEPALASTTLPHIKKIRNIVQENGALVGINASFFKPSSGVPLGTMIINQEIITGPIFNRVVLGIKDSKFQMAKISLNGTLTTQLGEEITINNINQPRMLSTNTLLYTYRWGKLAPPTPKYGIQLTVVNGAVSNVSKDRLEIPQSGYVIVGPQKQLGNLKIGDEVKIAFRTEPDWSEVDQAVSGGPYLVKEGQIYVDAAEQKFGSIGGRNPRTAVGYTIDNRLIMVTIDGRQQSSSGATLYELAKIMKSFGCYNAMNLDGGGSTQMVVLNKIVNNPCNKGGSFVSNGLVVKTKG